jgi:hypothetical protein
LEHIKVTGCWLPPRWGGLPCLEQNCL